jgi:hypothetical protein
MNSLAGYALTLLQFGKRVARVLFHRHPSLTLGRPARSVKVSGGYHTTGRRDPAFHNPLSDQSSPARSPIISVMLSSMVLVWYWYILAGILADHAFFSRGTVRARCDTSRLVRRRSCGLPLL